MENERDVIPRLHNARKRLTTSFYIARVLSHEQQTARAFLSLSNSNCAVTSRPFLKWAKVY